MDQLRSDPLKAMNELSIVLFSFGQIHQVGSVRRQGKWRLRISSSESEMSPSFRASFLKLGHAVCRSRLSLRDRFQTPRDHPNLFAQPIRHLH